MSKKNFKLQAPGEATELTGFSEDRCKSVNFKANGMKGYPDDEKTTANASHPSRYPLEIESGILGKASPRSHSSQARGITASEGERDLAIIRKFTDQNVGISLRSSPAKNSDSSSLDVVIQLNSEPVINGEITITDQLKSAESLVETGGLSGEARNVELPEMESKIDRSGSETNRSTENDAQPMATPSTSRRSSISISGKLGTDPSSSSRAREDGSSGPLGRISGEKLAEKEEGSVVPTFLVEDQAPLTVNSVEKESFEREGERMMPSPSGQMEPEAIMKLSGGYVVETEKPSDKLFADNEEKGLCLVDRGGTEDHLTLLVEDRTPSSDRSLGGKSMEEGSDRGQPVLIVEEETKLKSLNEHMTEPDRSIESLDDKEAKLMELLVEDFVIQQPDPACEYQASSKARMVFNGLMDEEIGKTQFELTSKELAKLVKERSIEYLAEQEKVFETEVGKAEEAVVGEMSLVGLDQEHGELIGPEMPYVLASPWNSSSELGSRTPGIRLMDISFLVRISGLHHQRDTGSRIDDGQLASENAQAQPFAAQREGIGDLSTVLVENQTPSPVGSFGRKSLDERCVNLPPVVRVWDDQKVKPVSTSKSQPGLPLKIFGEKGVEQQEFLAEEIALNEVVLHLEDSASLSTSLITDGLLEGEIETIKFGMTTQQLSGPIRTQSSKHLTECKRLFETELKDDQGQQLCIESSALLVEKIGTSFVSWVSTDVDKGVLPGQVDESKLIEEKAQEEDIEDHSFLLVQDRAYLPLDSVLRGSPEEVSEGDRRESIDQKHPELTARRPGECWNESEKVSDPIFGDDGGTKLLVVSQGCIEDLSALPVEDRTPSSDRPLRRKSIDEGSNAVQPIMMVTKETEFESVPEYISQPERPLEILGDKGEGQGEVPMEELMIQERDSDPGDRAPLLTSMVTEGLIAYGIGRTQVQTTTLELAELNEKRPSEHLAEQEQVFEANIEEGKEESEHGEVVHELKLLNICHEHDELTSPETVCLIAWTWYGTSELGLMAPKVEMMDILSALSIFVAYKEEEVLPSQVDENELLDEYVRAQLSASTEELQKINSEALSKHESYSKREFKDRVVQSEDQHFNDRTQICLSDQVDLIQMDQLPLLMGLLIDGPNEWGFGGTQSAIAAERLSEFINERPIENLEEPEQLSETEAKDEGAQHFCDLQVFPSKLEITEFVALKSDAHVAESDEDLLGQIMVLSSECTKDQEQSTVFGGNLVEHEKLSETEREVEEDQGVSSKLGVPGLDQEYGGLVSPEPVLAITSTLHDTSQLDPMTLEVAVTYISFVVQVSTFAEQRESPSLMDDKKLPRESVQTQLGVALNDDVENPLTLFAEDRMLSPVSLLEEKFIEGGSAEVESTIKTREEDQLESVSKSMTEADKPLEVLTDNQEEHHEVHTKEFVIKEADSILEDRVSLPTSMVTDGLVGAEAGRTRSGKLAMQSSDCIEERQCEYSAVLEKLSETELEGEVVHFTAQQASPNMSKVTESVPCIKKVQVVDNGLDMSVSSVCTKKQEQSSDLVDEDGRQVITEHLEDMVAGPNVANEEQLLGSVMESKPLPEQNSMLHKTLGHGSTAFELIKPDVAPIPDQELMLSLITSSKLVRENRKTKYSAIVQQAELIDTKAVSQYGSRPEEKKQQFAESVSQDMAYRSESFMEEQRPLSVDLSVEEFSEGGCRKCQAETTTQHDGKISPKTVQTATSPLSIRSNCGPTPLDLETMGVSSLIRTFSDAKGGAWRQKRTFEEANDVMQLVSDMSQPPQVTCTISSTISTFCLPFVCVLFEECPQFLEFGDGVSGDQSTGAAICTPIAAATFMTAAIEVILVYNSSPTCTFSVTFPANHCPMIDSFDGATQEHTIPHVHQLPFSAVGPGIPSPLDYAKENNLSESRGTFANFHTESESPLALHSRQFIRHDPNSSTPVDDTFMQNVCQSPNLLSMDQKGMLSPNLGHVNSFDFRVLKNQTHTEVSPRNAAYINDRESRQDTDCENYKSTPNATAWETTIGGVSLDEILIDLAFVYEEVGELDIDLHIELEFEGSSMDEDEQVETSSNVLDAIDTIPEETPFQPYKSTGGNGTIAFTLSNGINLDLGTYGECEGLISASAESPGLNTADLPVVCNNELHFLPTDRTSSTWIGLEMCSTLTFQSGTVNDPSSSTHYQQNSNTDAGHVGNLFGAERTNPSIHRNSLRRILVCRCMRMACFDEFSTIDLVAVKIRQLIPCTAASSSFSSYQYHSSDFQLCIHQAESKSNYLQFGRHSNSTAPYAHTATLSHSDSGTDRSCFTNCPSESRKKLESINRSSESVDFRKLTMLSNLGGAQFFELASLMDGLPWLAGCHIVAFNSYITVSTSTSKDELGKCLHKRGDSIGLNPLFYTQKLGRANKKARKRFLQERCISQGVGLRRFAPEIRTPCGSELVIDRAWNISGLWQYNTNRTENDDLSEQTETSPCGYTSDNSITNSMLSLVDITELMEEEKKMPPNARSKIWRIVPMHSRSDVRSSIPSVQEATNMVKVSDWSKQENSGNMESFSGGTKKSSTNEDTKLRSHNSKDRPWLERLEKTEEGRITDTMYMKNTYSNPSSREECIRGGETLNLIDSTKDSEMSSGRKQKDIPNTWQQRNVDQHGLSGKLIRDITRMQSIVDTPSNGSRDENGRRDYNPSSVSTKFALNGSWSRSGPDSKTGKKEHRNYRGKWHEEPTADIGKRVHGSDESMDYINPLSKSKETAEDRNLLTESSQKQSDWLHSVHETSNHEGRDHDRDRSKKCRNSNLRAGGSVEMNTQSFNGDPTSREGSLWSETPGTPSGVHEMLHNTLHEAPAWLRPNEDIGRYRRPIEGASTSMICPGKPECHTSQPLKSDSWSRNNRDAKVGEVLHSFDRVSDRNTRMPPQVKVNNRLGGSYASVGSKDHQGLIQTGTLSRKLTNSKEDRVGNHSLLASELHDPLLSSLSSSVVDESFYSIQEVDCSDPRILFKINGPLISITSDSDSQSSEGQVSLPLIEGRLDSELSNVSSPIFTVKQMPTNRTHSPSVMDCVHVPTHAEKHIIAPLYDSKWKQLNSGHQSWECRGNPSGGGIKIMADGANSTGVAHFDFNSGFHIKLDPPVRADYAIDLRTNLSIDFNRTSGPIAMHEPLVLGVKLPDPSSHGTRLRTEGEPTEKSVSDCLDRTFSFGQPTAYLHVPPGSQSDAARSGQFQAGEVSVHASCKGTIPGYPSRPSTCPQISADRCPDIPHQMTRSATLSSSLPWHQWSKEFVQKQSFGPRDPILTPTEIFTLQNRASSVDLKTLESMPSDRRITSRLSEPSFARQEFSPGHQSFTIIPGYVIMSYSPQIAWKTTDLPTINNSDASRLAFRASVVESEVPVIRNLDRLEPQVLTTSPILITTSPDLSIKLLSTGSELNFTSVRLPFSASGQTGSLVQILQPEVAQRTAQIFPYGKEREREYITLHENSTTTVPESIGTQPVLSCSDNSTYHANANIVIADDVQCSVSALYTIKVDQRVVVRNLNAHLPVIDVTRSDALHLRACSPESSRVGRERVANGLQQTILTPEQIRISLELYHMVKVPRTRHRSERRHKLEPIHVETQKHRPSFRRYRSLEGARQARSVRTEQVSDTDELRSRSRHSIQGQLIDDDPQIPITLTGELIFNCKQGSVLRDASKTKEQQTPERLIINLHGIGSWSRGRPFNNSSTGPTNLPWVRLPHLHCCYSGQTTVADYSVVQSSHCCLIKETLPELPDWSAVRHDCITVDLHNRSLVPELIPNCRLTGIGMYAKPSTLAATQVSMSENSQVVLEQGGFVLEEVQRASANWLRSHSVSASYTKYQLEKKDSTRFLAGRKDQSDGRGLSFRSP